MEGILEKIEGNCVLKSIFYFELQSFEGTSRSAYK